MARDLAIGWQRPLNISENPDWVLRPLRRQVSAQALSLAATALANIVLVQTNTGATPTHVARCAPSVRSSDRTEQRQAWVSERLQAAAADFAIADRLLGCHG